jgi:hypothetical protein
MRKRAMGTRQAVHVHFHFCGCPDLEGLVLVPEKLEHGFCGVVRNKRLVVLDDRVVV